MADVRAEARRKLIARLMVGHGGGHDDAVLAAGLAIEAVLAGTRSGRPLD